jgi:hypothetical protein
MLAEGATVLLVLCDHGATFFGLDVRGRLGTIGVIYEWHA